MEETVIQIQFKSKRGKRSRGMSGHGIGFGSNEGLGCRFPFFSQGPWPMVPSQASPWQLMERPATHCILL